MTPASGYTVRPSPTKLNVPICISFYFGNVLINVKEKQKIGIRFGFLYHSQIIMTNISHIILWNFLHFKEQLRDGHCKLTCIANAGIECMLHILFPVCIEDIPRDSSPAEGVHCAQQEVVSCLKAVKVVLL